MKKILIYVLILIAILGGIVFGINMHFNNVDEANNNTLISGNGNEPGWAFKINGANLYEKNVFIDLDLDYGEKKYIGMINKTWQENYEKEFQYRGDVTSPDGSLKKNIIIYFEKKTCHDDADISHELTVNVNLNGEREYRGCGNIK